MILLDTSGILSELTFLEDVGREAYRLVELSPADVEEARAVIARYRDHDLGLADASLVVLSTTLETLDLLTLDQRHFRVVRGWKGRPFRILPADS